MLSVRDQTRPAGAGQASHGRPPPHLATPGADQSAVTNDAPLLFFFCLAILLAPPPRRSHGSPRDRSGLVVGLGLLTKYDGPRLPRADRAAVGGRHSTAPWRLLAIVLAVSLSMLGLWLLAAQQMGVSASVAEHRVPGRRHHQGPALLPERRARPTSSAVGIFALPVILLGLVRCALRAARRCADPGVAGGHKAADGDAPLNRFFLPAFPHSRRPWRWRSRTVRRAHPRRPSARSSLRSDLIYYGWVDLGYLSRSERGESTASNAFHQDANHPEGASSSGALWTPARRRRFRRSDRRSDAANRSGSPRVSGRAGDRDRTGAVQLGKLAFYHSNWPACASC